MSERNQSWRLNEREICRRDPLHQARKLCVVEESGRHQWREKVPNADPSRLHLNTDLRPVSGSQQLIEAVKKRAALATENKDGVPCLEYLITAQSRTAFKSNGGYVDDEKFVKDSIEYLENKHGKDNIVALNIQHDEKTIHLVAFVVPLIEIKDKKVKRSIIVGKDTSGKLLREVREVAVKDFR